MVDRFQRFLFYISEISRHWHKIAGDEMEQYGLKGPHATYLVCIYRHPEGITAPRISERCGKDKSDVSRTMALMEKKGLVIKEGVHQNLYRGLYKLTDAGKEAAEKVSRRAALAVELAGRDLTEENRAIFYEALEQISDNLREISQNGLPKQ